MMTSRTAHRAGLAVGVAVAAVVSVMLLLPHHHGSRAATPPAAKVPASWARPVVDARGLIHRSGVEITQVAVSGDGGLIDLRYRVVDPEAASALHDPGTPPAVVDETTGLVVHTLLMNHAHSGRFKPGVTYYLVFDNPGNWLKRGSRVSVLLGDAQEQHLVLR